MALLEQDIETMRVEVYRAYARRDWFGWWFGSCVLLAWRLAHAFGAR